MLIRQLGNALDKARTALGFATIVRRSLALVNEASGPGRIPGDFMPDAYAKAIAEITPAHGRLVRLVSRCRHRLLSMSA